MTNSTAATHSDGAYPIAGPIEAEHRELRARLDALTATADRAGILAGLRGLPEKLAEHFADEETVGGLYDNLAKRCPAVHAELEVLRRQHRVILDDLTYVTADLEGQPTQSETISDAALGAIARCVERLRRHELAESKVISDVYYADDGGCG